MASFLHSCLKVPIDPCNNCPAPVYNRPKMYLGRLSMTPTAASTTLLTTSKTCNSDLMDGKWSCNGGIRPLTKFYDSIPDYGELTHLTEEEFYSTLDTLRSTCREFKTKPTNICFAEERCSSSTTTSSSLSSHCQSKKSKKSKKKKKSSAKHQRSNISESHESESIIDLTSRNKSIRISNSAYTPPGSKPHEGGFTFKSLKKELEEEVETFKKSLREYESQFKRPSVSSSSLLNRNESRSFSRCSSKEKADINEKDATEKVPVRSNFTSTLRERLRKSLSFNDIHSITEPIELKELRDKTKTLETLSYKGNKDGHKAGNKLSNYFAEKPDGGRNIPKIVVETPTTDTSSEREQSSMKSKNKSNDDNYKVPFKIFDLDSSKKSHCRKQNTPSPVHPVARPNLAATLRVECSKKKVKELKNNCTYHDKTPQVDWEVRKTPAWKTLSLNETHQEIIKLRLATRKAEQALQKREYELNMELMRQRVKSAPLLLEGPTHWGPNVGKLTHNCQREGRRHMCQTNQRKRTKKNSSRSYSCRRGLFHHSDPGVDYDHFLETSTTPNANRSQDSSRMSQKLNTLRKIYGGAGGKSQSRCSNHSTNTHISTKSSASKKKSQEKKTVKSEENFVMIENDSADELSSLDRAFL
ncbi:uncharacterized protein LOC101891184 [Musca domestica]|uniref:Uncharacterized protein LOC101891184 n=1 Tax=Musca domestica TaxID=7370 RepID=A0A9J7CU32_MUSDO|nr:uncharacterized protein LOC101891184 [Musca domestica]